MTTGIIYLFSKPDPNRPIEEQYVAEINNKRISFVTEDDAMLYLFDNGIRKFKRLTKETYEYKDASKLATFEFWHINNRVGYVTYGVENYLTEEDFVKKRKAFVWRFIGFGRPCFAQTEDELKEMVVSLIESYSDAPVEAGYRTYPYYTKHYRKQPIVK